MRSLAQLPARIACVTLLLVIAPGAATQNPTPLVQEAIRNQVERTGGKARIRVGGEWILAFETLPMFYELRGFEPAWLDGSRPAVRARALVQELRTADREGLRPDDYHLARVEALLAGPADPDGNREAARLAALDLLLTDAYLIYGAHLVNGRINPQTFEPDWIAARKEVDLAASLIRVVTRGIDVQTALHELRPVQPGYGALVSALARYRALAEAGGWPAVPPGNKLEPGQSGERVPVLRARLMATGELRDADPADAELYDETLADAVRRFQTRHGLEADGVIGPRTLEALNVPAPARVRQIELSLERWRWMPREPGDRYIQVNVPDFKLEVVEGTEPVLDMRVIVGRVVRRTPVFSDLMRYLVLSPSWEVPPTILRQDKIPEMRKDPTTAARLNMRVFRLIDGQWTRVDAAAVDWKTAHPGNTRIRQDPGPNNALGRVKFMFPNSFNVYLHDTPGRELFARSERDFSSGCIRIEKPLELALYLLRGTQWDATLLQAAMQSSREQTVMLPEPIPVHIQYWTVWAARDGSVQFRRDLYKRDERLQKALDLPPPSGPDGTLGDNPAPARPS